MLKQCNCQLYHPIELSPAMESLKQGLHQKWFATTRELLIKIRVERSELQTIAYSKKIAIRIILSKRKSNMDFRKAPLVRHCSSLPTSQDAADLNSATHFCCQCSVHRNFIREYIRWIGFVEFLESATGVVLFEMIRIPTFFLLTKWKLPFTSLTLPNQILGWYCRLWGLKWQLQPWHCGVSIIVHLLCKYTI